MEHYIIVVAVLEMISITLEDRVRVHCFHNNLTVLNTESNEWREIDCDNGPMKKQGCGMIPFSIDGEDYLLVIGGVGPVPANPPAHSQYTPLPNDPSLCYTNEIHMMCISTVPGIIIIIMIY